MSSARNLWFRVGKQYFPTLREAQDYKRKHGGSIEQVLSTVLPPVERPTKRVSPRRKVATDRKVSKRRSKYDPTAPLPDAITALL